MLMRYENKLDNNFTKINNFSFFPLIFTAESILESNNIAYSFNSPF